MPADWPAVNSLMHQQWGFFPFGTVLSGCDHGVGQPAVIGTFPVLVPEYISCPSLVCSVEHTIFSCTTGRKLGHRGRQGAARLPWPEQMVAQVWEHVTEYVTCYIEGAVVTDETGMFGVLAHSVSFAPSVLGILLNWVGFCVLSFLFS